MAEIDRTGVIWQLAADLAQARGEAQASGAVARAAAQLAGAEAVRVWVLDRRNGYRFAGAWPAEKPAPVHPPKEIAHAVVFNSPAAGKAPAPFRSRLVVPLAAGQRPIGAIELLEARRPGGAFTTEDSRGLDDLLRAADGALEAARRTTAREASHLEAVSRLTRLFDVSRSFAACVQLQALLRVIANRLQAALEVETALVWLPEEQGAKLRVAAATGPGEQELFGWEVDAAAGVAGEAAAAGEARLHDDPEAIPGLDERPDSAAGLAVTSVAAVPVVGEGEDAELLAVLEVLTRAGDRRLEPRDLLLLQEIASTAAVALGNVRRSEAERRASSLGSLLEVAQQLGSSLDATRVAFTLVHKAAAVLRYRRAAAGMLRGARFELLAVSGQTFVDEKVPDLRMLRDLLDWTSGLEEGIYVVQEEDGTIDTDRPEAQEKFRAYFAASGARSFLAIPLRDDQGRLGAFTLESAEPYGFAGHDLEAATLLAVQASGALRNAILFQQIPMARVFRPLARGRERLLALSWGRRLAWGIGALVLIPALLLVPFPLRVSGEAQLLPAARIPVTAEVEGRVARVRVREGDLVVAGQVVAELDDVEIRAAFEESRARYESGRHEEQRLRARGLAAEAAAEAARLEGARAERDLWEARLAATRIRAAAAGAVATPRVEDLTGTWLQRGDRFCEVVDQARQRIEIAVPEADSGALAAGMPVKVKLNAFPRDSFHATLRRIGVAAGPGRDGPTVLVQANLTDPPPGLLPGMAGRAKITVGPASAARIVLRRPARWIWGLIWGWLP